MTAKIVLDIGYRIVASDNSSFSELKREVMLCTSADICICFISEGEAGDLDVSLRSGIGFDKVSEWLTNLKRQFNFQNSDSSSPITTLRQFWKKHDQNLNVYAAVLGASEKLATQLSDRDYYIAVKTNSNSKRLEPLPVLEERIEEHPIIIKTIKDCLKFTKGVSFEQLILPRRFLTEAYCPLRDDIIQMSEYHLQPPYPLSVLSIPLNFINYQDSKGREIISIGLAWFGNEGSYAIDLDVSVIDQAVLLCRSVDREVITSSIDSNHLLKMLWDLDALFKALSFSRRQQQPRKILLQLIEGYDDKRIYADYEKNNKKAASGETMLGDVRKAVKIHLSQLIAEDSLLYDANVKQKLKNEGIEIDLDKELPTYLVLKALKCTKHFKGN